MRRSVDFERTPRPIVALADEYEPGFVDPCHSHRRAQLLYASSGVMSVVTDVGSFAVPPQRAVWLPPATEHEVSCRGPVSLRTLYIEPSAAAGLPSKPCVFEVSDLLRALIMEAMRLPPEYDETGRGARVVEFILYEIGVLPVADLYTPMPVDHRLVRVCRAILADPACNAGLDEMAAMAGMSRRTLTRVFRDETGMSVAAWRQHVRLLEALSLLAIGKPVMSVAFDVGYDSPSSFTAMFHKTFGVSPSQYFA